MAATKRSAGKPSKPVPVRWSPTPRGVEREKKDSQHERPDGHLEPPFDPMAYVRGLIRSVKDFPRPGILFRDITPLLADPKGFCIVLDALTERFVCEKLDAVVAIESRGFIVGGALAARLLTSFVPVRKAGRLPFQAERVSYSLEYGEAIVEMHRDALTPGSRVVIVDDLLATGGTAGAAAELVRRQKARLVACAFLIELVPLGGRGKIEPCPVVSLVRYQ